ncbi:UNVERIFIED_CONTAM: Ubiquitin carboxyl-terminal hydrolase 12 [Sesamum radiatum]|uniref:Ubiquitin carboxyl-terminal hydrolase 12 n=1 Tax=Sesamum radiatum TaxID=300843 RepID=A0AAW2SL46_SESRA
MPGKVIGVSHPLCHFMTFMIQVKVVYHMPTSLNDEPSSNLQLDVKGCHDVYTSFDKYVAVEHLDGVNRYHAGQYGLQINDRYEFPLELDLDRDNGRYLSPKANRRVRNLYTLHSILVHSDGVHGRHYYAFIRPTLSNQWY